MQGVDPPSLDGAPRRHQGLRRHLAAEGALAVALGVLAAKDVHLDRLEVQEIDEGVEGQ